MQGKKKKNLPANQNVMPLKEKCPSLGNPNKFLALTIQQIVLQSKHLWGLALFR